LTERDAPSPHAADPATRPCAEAPGYGVHPAARPAIAAFSEEVRIIVEHAEPENVPARVVEAMKPLLQERDLLADEHREGDDACYLRHLLSADPDGRFTILALVWKPGQTTTIHGHSAWGAVGVYEGQPNVACYDCDEASGDKPVPVLASDDRYGPGATCCVQPGIEDAHRIYNATDEDVITLHVYGRDLLRDPESINIVLAP
jgi:predicted metal-dependent enzyme (double-stranded beta helix superfamily)